MCDGKPGAEPGPHGRQRVEGLQGPATLSCPDGGTLPALALP